MLSKINKTWSAKVNFNEWWLWRFNESVNFMFSILACWRFLFFYIGFYWKRQWIKFNGWIVVSSEKTLMIALAFIQIDRCASEFSHEFYFWFCFDVILMCLCCVKCDEVMWGGLSFNFFIFFLASSQLYYFCLLSGMGWVKWLTLVLTLANFQGKLNNLDDWILSELVVKADKFSILKDRNDYVELKDFAKCAATD